MTRKQLLNPTKVVQFGTLLLLALSKRSHGFLPSLSHHPHHPHPHHQQQQCIHHGPRIPTTTPTITKNVSFTRHRVTSFNDNDLDTLDTVVDVTTQNDGIIRIGEQTTTRTEQANNNNNNPILPVLWTSLLITSNTVGAGMLVLPELCQEPGMGLSLSLFGILYIVNLLSGLVLAEVAIQQKETSGKDAPSSFKALAEENLNFLLNNSNNNKTNIIQPKDVIATISLVKNALVLAFGTMKAGQLGHDILVGNIGNSMILGNADILSILWVLGFATLLGTQSAPNLSKVASIFVAILFTSFAAILIPGLTTILQQPQLQEQVDSTTTTTTTTTTILWDILTQPGLSDDPISSLLQISPIILMSFIFQNIVPTTTRILDYDRTKVAISMVIGTFFPTLMYAAWCLAVLGGGIDTSISSSDGGQQPLLFTIFSIVTIAGSHLGSSTSMAEELDTYLRPPVTNKQQEPQNQNQNDDGSSVSSNNRKDDVFSFGSVGITAALAIGLGELFSNDLNTLLSIAGAYGSPLLYFVLPVIMAWNQQQQQQEETNTITTIPNTLVLTNKKQQQQQQGSVDDDEEVPKKNTQRKNRMRESTIPLAVTASAIVSFIFN